MKMAHFSALSGLISIISCCCAETAEVLKQSCRQHYHFEIWTGFNVGSWLQTVSFHLICQDSKAQLTADTIAKVIEGKIDIVNAAKLLNKSRRTIERYLHRYRKVGIQFVIHQNTGKTAYNKTCGKTKRKVQALIKKKYFDLNLQMDGSTHRWFGDKKSCLIALIDDASSEVHAEFFDAETTLGCLKVLRDYIERRGLFKVLYVDKAGIFGGPKRCNFSQVKRACEELGIEIIFANSAQGKGRIERSFDTFQDRLVPELRLKRIKRMESANRYLQGTFIPDYWEKQNKVVPRLPQNTHGPHVQLRQQILPYRITASPFDRKTENRNPHQP